MAWTAPLDCPDCVAIAAATEPPMETLLTLVLVYLAVGAALFAHPPGPLFPPDFDWRRQIAVFCDSLPEVLGWPLALWRWLR
jgi:hypothetical protein